MSRELGEEQPPPAEGDAGPLPSKLRYALWRKIDRRLLRGEVLITAEQFEHAMEVEFRRLVRLPASVRVREAIRAMVAAVNEQHPETFLGLGIRNAITRYLANVMAHQDDKSAAAMVEVRRRLWQLVRDGRTAFFLESIGVEVGQRGLPPSVEQAIARMVQGEPLTAAPARAPGRPRRRSGGAVAPAGSQDVAFEEQVRRPEAQESRERVQLVEAGEKALADEEVVRARQRLDYFVRQGTIREDEAVTLRELYGLDERLARGEVTQAEADGARQRLQAGLRPDWEQRLRQAIDPTVRLLSAVDFLRRLPSGVDPALRLLIRHRDLVTTDDPAADMEPVRAELEAHEDLLVALSAVVERREHEVRMIAANLPPYRYLLERGGSAPQGIEEGLVDELRSLDRPGLPARLAASDKDAGSELLARVADLVRLIARAAGTTPFHRAARRARVRQTVTQLFTAASDARAGRQRVVRYLNQQLPRLYPGMTEPEHASLRQEAEALMGQLEGRWDKAGGGELRYYRA